MVVSWVETAGGGKDKGGREGGRKDGMKYLKKD